MRNCSSVPVRRSDTTFTRYGITSPARSRSTVSPMRTSFRSISSMLWSEQLRTVTPPTCTGSSSATGVSTPVRPTDGNMRTMRVVAWRALNL